jgi:hypothetical protein
MKLLTKKLSLSTHKIRVLDTSDLAHVNGGSLSVSQSSGTSVINPSGGITSLHTSLNPSGGRQNPSGG